MGNVYVRLTECEIRKIQQALSAAPGMDASNLVSKMDLLITEMQPGTTLTLEAVQKPRKKRTG